MQTARALVAAAFLAGTAVSTPVSATPDQARKTSADQTQARPVLICARDAASRRAFARQYGARPVFITAREAAAVRPSEPAWTAPRCMTEIEYAKLRDANAANARVP